MVFAAGEFTTRVIRTVGFPAAGIGVEGELPAGLTFADNGDGTASIAGTPLDGPTSSPVTLTAVNVVSDASLTTVVRVVAPPAVTVRRPGCLGRRAATRTLSQSGRNRRGRRTAWSASQRRGADQGPA